MYFVNKQSILSIFLYHAVHENKICIHTKTIRKIQVIKGLYSATTFITPKKIFKNKHEMMVHLNQKLGEEKGLLQ